MSVLETSTMNKVKWNINISGKIPYGYIGLHQIKSYLWVIVFEISYIHTYTVM